MGVHFGWSQFLMLNKKPEIVIIIQVDFYPTVNALSAEEVKMAGGIEFKLIHWGVIYDNKEYF